jgi:hypothetical protein
MPTLETCEEFIMSGQEKSESPPITSDAGKNQTNSGGFTQSLKSGDEPTALLLALASGPLLTLWARKRLKISVGNGLVVITITNARFDQQKGITEA